jgi:hypothetical protein
MVAIREIDRSDSSDGAKECLIFFRHGGRIHDEASFVALNEKAVKIHLFFFAKVRPLMNAGKDFFHQFVLFEPGRPRGNRMEYGKLIRTQFMASSARRQSFCCFLKGLGV